MDCGKNSYIDISPWMLVEASGDSENIDSDVAVSCSYNSRTDLLVGSDDGCIYMGKMASSFSGVVRLQTSAAVSLAEDDAFSCSWDDGDHDDRYNDMICRASDYSSFRSGGGGYYNGNELQLEQRRRDDVINREYDDPWCREGEEEDDDDGDEDAVDQVREAGSSGVDNSSYEFGGINSDTGGQTPEPPAGTGGGGGAMEVMMMNMMGLAEAGQRQQQQQQKKSKPAANCGKLPAELMIKQRDTDRLFWEACLSS